MEDIVNWLLSNVAEMKVFGSMINAMRERFGKRRRTRFSAGSEVVQFLLSREFILTDKTHVLLLLWQSRDWSMSGQALFRRSRFTRRRKFDKRVLRQLKREGLVNFDPSGDLVELLPTGNRYVCDKIIRLSAPLRESA